MKNLKLSAVRSIDLAIKELNNTGVSYQAEHFLLSRPFPKNGGGTESAVFLVRDRDEESGEENLSLGIYFNPRTRENLKEIDKVSPLRPEDLEAFAVVAEEISHFHYMLFHLPGGRSLRKIELELQGEVDSFLLSFFLSCEKLSLEEAFQSTFESLFEKFHLRDHLDENERSRYEYAIGFAKRFIAKLKPLLTQPEQREALLKWTRKFYRLSFEEKLSWIKS